MPFYALDDKRPKLLGAGHFIAPSAAIIGDVELAEQTSVWFNAVIRAENDRIRIAARSNIQDAAVLHVDPGMPLTIGSDVTVGHKAMLHGCTIGNGSLIGINAVVLNGAVVGERCLIGANALVTENMQVPDGALVLGSPAKVIKIMDAERQQMIQQGAANYVRNAERFQQLQPVDMRTVYQD
ncbi:MAG: gamma carbonic anhydrase family protein [Pseudomonadales bacterium]|nr:gamma carbonic anhydrase family protein [Pseudomonadales bacterium]